jgi:hypothetical protein
MPLDRDPAYLWDMLQFARQAERLARGVSLEKYKQDEVRRLAIERVI